MKYQIAGAKRGYGLRLPPATYFAIGAPTPESGVEGNSGTVAFTFPVARTGDLSTAVTLDWSVSGVGANPTNASDFASATSGTLSFAANEAAAEIVVEVQGDTSAESDEAFQVLISNPSIGAIIDAAAIATIVNDDVAGPPVTTGQLDFSKAANSGLLILEVI